MCSFYTDYFLKSLLKSTSCTISSFPPLSHTHTLSLSFSLSFSLFLFHSLSLYLSISICKSIFLSRAMLLGKSKGTERCCSKDISLPSWIKQHLPVALYLILSISLLSLNHIGVSNNQISSGKTVPDRRLWCVEELLLR